MDIQFVKQKFLLMLMNFKTSDVDGSNPDNIIHNLVISDTNSCR